MLKPSSFTLTFKVASFCLKSKWIKVGLCHSYAFGGLDALVFPWLQCPGSYNLNHECVSKVMDANVSCESCFVHVFPMQLLKKDLKKKWSRSRVYDLLLSYSGGESSWSSSLPVRSLGGALPTPLSLIVSKGVKYVHLRLSHPVIWSNDIPRGSKLCIINFVSVKTVLLDT